MPSYVDANGSPARIRKLAAAWEYSTDFNSCMTHAANQPILAVSLTVAIWASASNSDRLQTFPGGGLK